MRNMKIRQSSSPGTEIAVSGNGHTPGWENLPPEVREAHRRGQSVIPIGVEKGGKKPLVRWKAFQECQPTPGELVRWSHQFGERIVAWARITGAHSELIVLDDDGEGWLEKWGVQPHVRTGSGGYHWIGRHPGWRVKTMNSQSSDRNWATYPHLDIRGDGGYSIICGTNAKGVYEWLRSPEPDELDVLPMEVREFFGLLEPPKEKPASVRARAGVDSNERVTAGCLVQWAINKIEEVGRNNAGLMLACQLRDNDYTREEALGVGKDYVERCPRTNTKGNVEDYGMDDYTDSVKQAYRRPAREPWGPKNGRQVDMETGEISGNEEGEDEEEEAPRKGRAKNRDDRLAHAWAESVRGRVLFVEGNQWWRYDDDVHYWRAMETAEAEIAVQRFLRARGNELSVKRIREVLTLARERLGPVPMAAFDACSSLIPLSNGVYDVDRGKLIDHAPAHRNTYCLDYPYDANATCPLTQAFLREVLVNEDGTTCEEWLDFIWEWMGYCLTADARAHTALVNVGDGGNGKGTFARLLRALVGSRQCAAVSIEDLAHEYNRAHLVGKLVGFINEPTRRAMDRGGEWLKAISAGDDVPARHPCGRVFTFCPVARFVVSCNDLPATKDLTHGYFRRLVIVQWRFTPPIPNLQLDAELAEELSGVFNAAVEGLRRFQSQGNHFGRLPGSDAIKAEYRRSQDTVALFLEDDCVACETGTTSDALYRAYQDWCYRNGFRGDVVLTSVAFGKALTRLGVASSISTTTASDQRVRIRPKICLIRDVQRGNL